MNARAITSGKAPNVQAFIDLDWDSDDRDLVAAYAANGTVAGAYVGFSACRLCGTQNGSLEFSDGTYAWPEGLAHYVREHGIRPPEQFVNHALERATSLEEAERDADWWRSQGRAQA